MLSCFQSGKHPLNASPLLLFLLIVGACIFPTALFAQANFVPNGGGRNYLNGIEMGSAGIDTSTMQQITYPWEWAYDYSYDTTTGDGPYADALKGYPFMASVYSQGTDHQHVVDGLKVYANQLYATRVDQEFNCFSGPSVDTATWIASFRDLASLIHQQLPGVKVIWNACIGNNDPYPYYPGDDVVDIVSYDAYCQQRYASSGQSCWDDFLNGAGGTNFTKLSEFGKQHNKPLAILEWGSDFNDGVYIQQLCRWADQNNVVAMGYWNSADDLQRSARLSENPVDQQAYLKYCANRPYTGTYWSKIIPIPTGAIP
jgi:hypothetical protein